MSLINRYTKTEACVGAFVLVGLTHDKRVFVETAPEAIRVSFINADNGQQRTIRLEMSDVDKQNSLFQASEFGKALGKVLVDSFSIDLKEPAGGSNHAS